jgi:uncharacterized protein
MKCPVCKEPDLALSERQGVEIDYCPACRGIWLDRGELDKIIEKSVQLENARPVPGEAPRPAMDPYYSGHFEDRGHHDDHHEYGGHRGKRKSWLGDLFD